MVGLIFRLCAVYVGAAAILIYLARRVVRPLGLASAAFLTLAPLLFTGRAMLTGGVYAPLDISYTADPLLARREALGLTVPRNPMLADVVQQGIPWQAAVREAIEAGRPPLWNRFALAGQPLLAVQQHGVLHPTFWLGLLLPPAQAWTLSMALRLLLALLSAYLFFRELGCGELPSLLGASAWAFSDFLIFFLGLPLNSSTSVWPLLLVGLRRLARSPGRPATAITLAALLLMTTAGHPETVLHGIAGAGIYFLFELVRAPGRRRGRALAQAALCGALALGLSAVLFLPFREAAVHTVEYKMRAEWYATSQRSVSLMMSAKRSIKNVVPYAFGYWRVGGEKVEFFGAAAYAGALLLPLAMAGLFSRRPEKWPLLIVGLLGLSAWARLPVINDAICRLPLFDLALNEYLVAWGAFCGVALAVFGVEMLATGERRWLVPACSGIAALAIGLLFVRALPNLVALPRPTKIALLATQLLPVAMLGVGTLLVRPLLLRRAAPAGLLILLLAQRVAEVGSFYPSAPAPAFAPPLPFLDGIPRERPVRMAALGHMFLPNVATLYGLEDVRGYEVMTFAPLVETFPLWCIPQTVWFNRVDDPAKPFLSFLNVRYFIAPRGYDPPAGWRVLAEEAGGRLLENPGALARFFVPRRIYREPSIARQLRRLSTIRDFGAEGVLEGAPTASVENGSADVRIVSYAAETIDLSIEAREAAVVASSMTAWPGWRLFVDGEDRPLQTYNRAFFAFDVSPGHHHIALRYRPRSFIAGLWISGLSLLAAGAFFLWPRRDVMPHAPATGGT